MTHAAGTTPSTAAGAPAPESWEGSFAALAAPLPRERIAWRQDGKVRSRGDGTFAARFVCYVEAGTVRERLDRVFPGEWSLDLQPLPQVTTADADGVDNSGVAFLARLTVAGVTRTDAGQGRDWKSASTDAFKRAAVRFG
ncbi:MAG: Rad52/Rad22 family DNA repair protein, partial [Gemmatimonadaceae bacterium]